MEVTMISTFINRVSSFLYEKRIIEEEQIPVINYGLHYLLINIITIGTLIIIGIIFSQLLQMIGLVIGFFLIRNTIGGYHTKKESTCFILTVSMLTGDLILINLLHYFNFGPLLLLLLLIVAWFLIIIVKPMEHENRKFTQEEFKSFRHKSILNMLLITIVSIVSTLIFDDVGLLFGTSLLIGVLTAIFAVIIVRKNNKKRDVY